jgi:YVTN family beta-propeller protein
VSRRSFITIVAFVAVTTACGGAVAARKPKPKPKPLPNPGAALRAKLLTGQQPCGEVEGFGSMWISNFGSNTLSRIDPATNKVIATIKIGASPCGLAVGHGSVWINAYGTNSVERVDAATNTLVAHIPTGNATYDVLDAAGSAWTTNNLDNTVSRIDPATNTVTKTIAVPGGPAGLAFAAGGVWVGTNASDDVYRIDPATNAVTKIPLGRSTPAWFASRGDELWVASGGTGLLIRIDPATNAVTDTVRVGAGPTDGVIDANGLIWVPNLKGNSVSVVDAPTATLVSTIRVGPSPFVLNDGFGDVWSGSYGGHDVWRLRPPKLVTAPLTGRPGTVRLIAVDAKRTLVTVVLDAASSDPLPVHVHAGRCGALTQGAVPPHTLTGRRTAFAVAMPFKTLSAGRFALDVHAAASDPQIVGCADLG